MEQIQRKLEEVSDRNEHVIVLIVKIVAILATFLITSPAWVSFLARVF